MDEALQQAKRVTEASPNEPVYLDTLAQVQARAGHCEQAIEIMQRVVRMQPDNPQWQDNLAKILAQCGQEDRASQVRKETGETVGSP